MDRNEMPREVRLSSAEIARAIYDVLKAQDRGAYFSEFDRGRVTIDGRFNLAKAAAQLRRRLGV